MINNLLSLSVENTYLEPFEDRVDTLFHELELATKWRRPSVLWAIYSSEFVRADADSALERRLHNLGQSAYHIKIEDPNSADVSLQISELTGMDNVVFFVEGLRWGAGQDNQYVYHKLDNRREFIIDNQIRIVFWLTEKEAIDLAHCAPDYWALRHRVIEFFDPPRPDQISPYILESAWRGTGEITSSADDLDDKIALRTALLSDLPAGDESTDSRANLLMTLGLLHWRRGDYERATEFLNTALDLSARLEDNSFEAICFNAIALVQSDQGRIEEAIQSYDNAISLAPDQIFPWTNLGYLHRKLSHHEEARAAFQKAVDQNGSDAMAWNGLGDVYHESKQNEKAIQAYLKAIEFSSEYAHSWCGLGNSQLDEGHLDEALRAHQRAIEIDRQTVESWLGLGDIYGLQESFESASMAYQTALEIDPKNALAWNNLGNLYYRKGAQDEALRSYLKGIEFNKGCCLTYGNLADIYSRKGLYSEAISLLLRGLELSEEPSSSAELWKRLGDVYQKFEDDDHALSAYQKAEALSAEITSHQIELSTTQTDHQITELESPASEPEARTRLDPTEDEQMGSEAIKILPAQSSNNLIRTEDPDITSTLPDPEFVEWLDGLSSVLPVPVESETTDSDPASTNKDDKPEDSLVLENEDEEKVNKPDTTVSPENEGLCEASEASPDAPIEHDSSDLPFDEASLLTSYQGMNCSHGAEVSNPSPAISSQENDANEGAATVYESHSQDYLAEGEDAIQSQVKINEKNAQIWNELGNIYYNSGAFDEAMHAFEMAIELDPSFGWSYNNLASIYFHSKRYTEAIPLYEKSIQLLNDEKDKALLWNRMGDAYRRLNKHSQAVDAYRNAMDLDPENVSLLTRARFSLLGNHRI
jgi:tetratricopeptide (TPR) repeat protein